MPRFALRAGLMAALIFVSAARCSAWSKIGHMVTGSIAYRVLRQNNPQLLSQLIDILEDHPEYHSRWEGQLHTGGNSWPDANERLFMLAARWPDDSADGHGRVKGKWHYIDNPFKPAGQPNSVHVDPPDPENNVVTALALNLNELSGSDSEAQAVALCWVLHLCGDAHQPLHAISLFTTDYPSGDVGGNLFKVKAGGEAVDLHHFWDALVLSSGNMRRVRNRAVELMNAYPVTAADAAVLDAQVWTDASFELAKSYGYRNGTLPGSRSNAHAPDLPDGYAAEVKPIAERQAVLAGHRMARLLIHTLSPGAPVTPHGVALAPAFAPLAAEAMSASGARPRFGSFDPSFPPPQGEPAFELSQDYPAGYNLHEVFTWEEIDFRTSSQEYLKAVLKYCLEGNVNVDFRGQNNAVRKWYHAPWMHDDSRPELSARKGREFRRGLTRERFSRQGELGPLQTTDFIQNWAVSLYNDRGGYTLGKVWLTPDGRPNPYAATFPDHAVSFKLLFTAAPVAEAPYLENSPRWVANINPDGPPPMGAPFQRVDREMRLLQVDLAVKDPRVADTTGWIFGTFVYDGSQPSSDPWERLTPVGLSWGDEANERRMIDQTGSFVNPYLRESSLNAALIPPSSNWGNHAYVTHFGLGGRLNGPVDNPYSSCISCHGRAGVLNQPPSSAAESISMPIVAGNGGKEPQIQAFDNLFRPIRGGSHLEEAPIGGGAIATFVTLDYSLQLSNGIANYYRSALSVTPPAPPGLNLDAAVEAIPAVDAAARAPASKTWRGVSRDENDDLYEQRMRRRSP